MTITTRAVAALALSLANLAAQLAMVVVFAFSVFAPVIAGMALSLPLAIWTIRMARAAQTEQATISALATTEDGGASPGRRGLAVVAVSVAILSAVTAAGILVWVATVCPHEHDC